MTPTRVDATSDETRTASQRITHEVTSWPGIESGPGRRGGRVGPHPVVPNAQGPAARRIESEDDIRDVIALMRLNYDRLAKAVPPATAAPAQP